MDNENINVEQEVINEVDDNVQENIDVDDNVVDNEDNQEESQDEEFDPDKLFEDENYNYQFGQYDLSKYKDVFDFDNEELISEFTQYAKEYSDRGFTQEQIEFILDDKIKDLKSEEPKHIPTQKEIKEKLNNSLSREEKRNYSMINNFIGNVLKGSELEGKEKEIMQNPALVKMLNLVYKNSLNATTNIKSMQKPKEKQIKSISLDEAKEVLMDGILNGTADENLIKSLKTQVTDIESFDILLEALGRK